MPSRYCRTCRYDLTGLSADGCPECGTTFDPADPTTYDRRRLRPQPLVGIGFAALIGGVGVLAFRVAYVPDYGTSFGAASLTFNLIGLVLAVAAAGLAAWNRSWWGRVPLLLVGVLGLWAGLLLGLDLRFRVWQSMPDPPDEAFADGGPMMGALFLGWIPASFVVVAAFGAAVLVGCLRRRYVRSRNVAS